ncbi:MAG: hypothetical protein Ct9H300mP26_1190 [Acidimicrobiales bacterium]|nr:MAG: hypothetical protein Ct9H300mP26_1190 [Acidimicrobiales bacterium]
MATGEIIGFEELGGVDVHSRITGQIDIGVDTFEEGYAAVRRWLSYLPSNAWTTAPRSDFRADLVLMSRWLTWFRSREPAAMTCADLARLFWIPVRSGSYSPATPVTSPLVWGDWRFLCRSYREQPHVQCWCPRSRSLPESYSSHVSMRRI